MLLAGRDRLLHALDGNGDPSRGNVRAASCVPGRCWPRARRSQDSLRRWYFDVPLMEDGQARLAETDSTRAGTAARKLAPELAPDGEGGAGFWRDASSNLPR